MVFVLDVLTTGPGPPGCLRTPKTMLEDRYHCKSMPPSCLLYPFNVLVVVFLCLKSINRRTSPRGIPVKKISCRHRRMNSVDFSMIITIITDFRQKNALSMVTLRYRRRIVSVRNVVCRIGYRQVKDIKWCRRDFLSERGHRRRFQQTGSYSRQDCRTARMRRRWFTNRKGE